MANPMRFPLFACIVIAVTTVASAQPTPNSTTWVPKDPRDMLNSALPLYSFNMGSVAPWHLKGSYQLYDEAGNPSTRGTYEYWQEAPNVSRTSWNRPDATRTEWHRADGTAVYKDSGDRLFYFEHELKRFLLNPVPDPSRLDSTEVELKKDSFEAGKIKLPCAEVKARMRSDGTTPISLDVPAANYCFDTSLPVLRLEHLLNSVYVHFDKLAKWRDRVLAQEITVTDGQRKLLVFNLDVIEGFSQDNTMFTPPPEAVLFAAEKGHRSENGSRLIKKAPPVYPLAAKASHVAGIVLLDVLVGQDGKVKDIRVLSTPSPLLSSPSKEAVAQWQYVPYTIDGQPKEFNTVINVVFSLGR